MQETLESSQHRELGWRERACAAQQGPGVTGLVQILALLLQLCNLGEALNV